MSEINLNKCAECNKRIEPGEARVLLPIRAFHANCFLDYCRRVDADEGREDTA